MDEPGRFQDLTDEELEQAARCASECIEASGEMNNVQKVLFNLETLLFAEMLRREETP